MPDTEFGRQDREAALKRILLLGTTGVDKVTAWNRLTQERARRATDQHTSVPPTPVFLDFEKTFLKVEARTLYSFLDDTESAQQQAWDRAWDKLASKLKASDDSFAVAVHAAFVRDEFGTRSFLAPEKLKDLGFTDIVTLIDDVYSCWWRTESRAINAKWVGRPSLLQLMQGRQAELLLGDLAARSLGLRNTLLSVLHPARVLDRLIFGDGDLRSVYLSFPISGPRRRDGSSGITEISSYISRAAALERSRENTVCFCPLAIDEIPLTLERPVKIVKEPSGKEVEYVEFTPSRERWKLDQFWPNDILMGSVIDETMSVPRSQVVASAGAIVDEVGVRDYRLLTHRML
jgi:hypothetical protein